MRSLNRVVLMGNLVADPEVRETTTGKTVANFSVATNRRWKSKDGSEEGKTDFHRIVAWQKLGEICGEYLKKGSSVYLEGLLSTRSYETEKGEKRYFTEVVANNVNILTWKKNKQGEPAAEIKPIDKDDEIIDEEE